MEKTKDQTERKARGWLPNASHRLISGQLRLPEAQQSIQEISA